MSCVAIIRLPVGGGGGGGGGYTRHKRIHKVKRTLIDCKREKSFAR